MRRSTLHAAILLSLLAPARAPGEDVPRGRRPEPPPPARLEADHARHIEPLLRKRCYRCHGSRQQKAGLRLDVREPALAGGDSGPVIVPGRSAASVLIQRVASKDPEEVMPPSGEKLSPEEIALLREWIDRGAAWSDAAAPAEERLRTRSDHWSFQRLLDPAVPRVETSGWVRSPIDAFVLRRLERLGIEPSPEADRATLLRRLHLDLTGLPPSGREVEDFVADDSPQAYERLVDRLLASPHFGERWGRHWLDLARYADSDGYEKDLPRPHAWRYRGWVIDAINADLPFDRFTVEQLAGDLLDNPSLEQRVATGFHRNTLTNTEGGTDQEEDRVKKTVDRTNATASVWLGLTFACAQCHSHKYDPITQREYYQLYAFFNTAKEDDIEAPLPAERDAYLRAARAFESRRVLLERALNDLVTDELAARQAAWEKSVTLGAGRGAGLPGDVKKILEVERSQRPPGDLERLAAYYRANGPDVDPRIAAAQRALDEHAKSRPAKPATRAQTLAEQTPRRETRVLTRGDFLRPGARVDAGTPGVLPPFESRGAGGDRLDLARWLVAPENPLTPRVEANRIWQRLFGRGIVRSPEDFGTRGERPTHPELLDWLGREHRRRGWSLKRTVRSIVLSSTYRQRSDSRPDLLRSDPDNRLLARQNRFRLEAETLRDVFLASSGLLATKIGGPSVRPPLPPGVRELGYAGSVKWPVSTGPDRYRRGLYIFFQRTVPYPMLTTFDAPDSNVACLRRPRSNTPLQALTLLGDPVFHEAARALGERVVREVDGGVPERARHLFLLAVSRCPEPAELARLEALYRDLSVYYRESPDEAARMVAGAGEAGRPVERAAWIAISRVVLNLDEAVTRN